MSIDSSERCRQPQRLARVTSVVPAREGTQIWRALAVPERGSTAVLPPSQPVPSQGPIVPQRGMLPQLPDEDTWKGTQRAVFLEKNMFEDK